MNLTLMLMIGIPVVLVLSFIFYVFKLRRIVPTNVVHIVQRGKYTVSYGVGKTSNVYYHFPKWMPFLGVEVRELPVSNFGIDLPKYSAYDKDRVPFEVDVLAFFHISDTNKAAEKVASFQDLTAQLTNVVKGAVRSILAKSKLEQIMEERSVFGQQFTDAVREDLKSWGVEPIKSIELMDVRDVADSKVIHQIMAKRISGIDMESRMEVAKNSRAAQQAELEATKDIAMTRAETERASGEAQARARQAVGQANAESEKNVGIAKQEAATEIARSAVTTAQQEMEVQKVNQVMEANINKEKSIVLFEQEKRQTEIKAEAEKYKIETAAEAELNSKRKIAEATKTVGQAEADVTLAKGQSAAESKKLLELAGVTAQTTLAEKIGSNKDYQDYMVRIKEVEVGGEVNKVQYQSLATALKEADLKIMVNSGDVHSGLNKFTDILSPKGGQAITGLLESLKQTPEGEKIVEMLSNLGKKK